ncbi:hypothetical protein [Kitasatospora sp. NPDC089509]|uniref:hypothetical protein n=1 Tax=Kitasatospora sp. NPDC089509 TaxID=3364079 RepID=UPI00381FD59F
MRMTIRRTVAAVAVTAAAAVMTTVGAGTAQASTWAGCPDGAVCVYPQDQNPAVSPMLTLWSYGPHNLSNMYGNHWVLNNQTGGAGAQLCTGYNGTGSCEYIAAQNGVYANLTPINSIVLLRP